MKTHGKTNTSQTKGTTMIIKATKKPVQVEAIKWTGENSIEVDAFCTHPVLGSRSYHHDIYNDGIYHLKIRTLEGNHTAKINSKVTSITLKGLYR